jgi:hypothetical protein
MFSCYVNTWYGVKKFTLFSPCYIRVLLEKSKIIVRDSLGKI